MNTETKSPRLIAPGHVVPLVLVTMLFFLWGIPNNLSNILIRQFTKSFELNRFQVDLVQSSFYLGYFLLAIPAAPIIRKYSDQGGPVMGPVLFGSGALLFWPVAIVGRYGVRYRHALIPSSASIGRSRAAVL